MPAYAGRSGVVREIGGLAVGVSGTARTVYDGWVGRGGTKREFLWGHITADFVSQLELVPDTIRKETIEEDSYTKLDSTSPVHSQADLGTVSGYGTVRVDESTKTFTVLGSTRGKYLTLEFTAYVRLKNGRRELLNSRFAAALDSPQVTAHVYASNSGGSSSHGLYGDSILGTAVLDGYFTGSTSRTSTFAPSSAYSYVAGGMERGSGTERTEATIQKFTVSGQSIPVAVVWE